MIAKGPLSSIAQRSVTSPQSIWRNSGIMSSSNQNAPAVGRGVSGTGLGRCYQ
jgi:hypothetical protein